MSNAARSAADDPVASLGRFSEPGILILISLADGPKHGYAMTKDIETLSGQRLGPGTLYGAIARLEERQWIQALPTDNRRRPYKLTSAGRSVLRTHLDRMKVMARIGCARLAT